MSRPAKVSVIHRKDQATAAGTLPFHSSTPRPCSIPRKLSSDIEGVPALAWGSHLIDHSPRLGQEYHARICSALAHSSRHRVRVDKGVDRVVVCVKDRDQTNFPPARFKDIRVANCDICCGRGGRHRVNKGCRLGHRRPQRRRTKGKKGQRERERRRRKGEKAATTFARRTQSRVTVRTTNLPDLDVHLMVPSSSLLFSGPPFEFCCVLKREYAPIILKLYLKLNSIWALGRLQRKSDRLVLVRPK